MYNIYTVKYWRCSKYRIKKIFVTNNISIVLLHHSLSGKKLSKKKILLIIIVRHCCHGAGKVRRYLGIRVW